MLVILKLLARPLIEAAVSAFGQVLLDFFAAWRAREDAKALGRADAERDAMLAAEAARGRMEGVMELSEDDVVRRLREGKA